MASRFSSEAQLALGKLALAESRGDVRLAATALIKVGISLLLAEGHTAEQIQTQIAALAFDISSKWSEVRR